MPDPTLRNNNTGTSSTATTTATFGFTATAGRLLVFMIGSDAYKSSDPTNYILSTNMDQRTNLGHTIWWKIATGAETNVQYTIGAATSSAWIVLEFDNIDPVPYDISDGHFEASSTSTVYTSPIVATTAGRRLAIASIGGARGDVGDWGSMATWINSYTAAAQVFNNAAVTNDIIGAAYLVFDGGGTTQGGATLSQTPDAETGLIIVFKAAASGGPQPFSGKRMIGVGYYQG